MGHQPEFEKITPLFLPDQTFFGIFGNILSDKGFARPRSVPVLAGPLKETD